MLTLRKNYDWLQLRKYKYMDLCVQLGNLFWIHRILLEFIIFVI